MSEVKRGERPQRATWGWPPMFWRVPQSTVTMGCLSGCCGGRGAVGGSGLPSGCHSSPPSQDLDLTPQGTPDRGRAPDRLENRAWPEGTLPPLTPLTALVAPGARCPVPHTGRGAEETRRPGARLPSPPTPRSANPVPARRDSRGGPGRPRHRKLLSYTQLKRAWTLRSLCALTGPTAPTAPCRPSPPRARPWLHSREKLRVPPASG